MRSRILLSALVSLTFFFSHVLLGKKDEPVNHLSVRQQFESHISNLKRNLEDSKKSNQKWTIVEKFEAQIKALRKKNPVQVEPDEFFMDQFTSSLGAIPRGKSFQKAQCEDYKTSIQAQHDPREEDPPTGPVGQALAILEILCR